MALVEVTDTAADRIRALLDREGKLETHALRLKVIGGGCSGLQYQLGFDDEVADADTAVEKGEIRVVVDEKSALCWWGSSRDDVDSLQEAGFKITNPNASSTCGCGQSFGA